MLPACSLRSLESHETVDAFQSIGFPLNKTLVGMLNEEPEHQRPRRGSGFTQASRYLADLVNQPRALYGNLDMGIFSAQGKQNFSKIVSTAKLLSQCEPATLLDLDNILNRGIESSIQTQIYANQTRQLISLPSSLEQEESRLISELILSILGSSKVSENTPVLDLHNTKLAIGTCPEAERYFLELCSGYQRRHSVVNVITDQHNDPLLVEKVNLGDSHSCISLKSLILNHVVIPPGALLGTQYSNIAIDSIKCREFNGVFIPAIMCDGFRFLRLTTLSVSPQNRHRAFGNHLAGQLADSAFFDPANTRLPDLCRLANEQ